jgi:hypothetical protein
MAEIIDLCSLYPEAPRVRIDQIVTDMEGVVREAHHLSEILVDVFSNKWGDSSLGAREYVAGLLREKNEPILHEWRRAFEATHPASKSAE